MLDFQCSPDVSLQDLGSGWISEPQRGPTVAVLIMAPARNARFSMLPRRLPAGSRLRLDFRAPERANSSRSNHIVRRSYMDRCSCELHFARRFRADCGFTARRGAGISNTWPRNWLCGTPEERRRDRVIGIVDPLRRLVRPSAQRMTGNRIFLNAEEKKAQRRHARRICSFCSDCRREPLAHFLGGLVARSQGAYETFKP